MAQYDGSIIIDTSIQTKQAQHQLDALENRIVKSAGKIDSLRSKLDLTKDVKLPTQEYTDIQNQIESTEKKIVDLTARQEKFLATGGKVESSAYKKMQYDVDELRQSLSYLKGEEQDLISTGKAFTIGNPEQAAALEQQIKQEESALALMLEKRDILQSKIQAQAEEEQRLAEIKENATVSDQKLVDLLEQRRQLLEQIKDLEKAGVTEGYQEYDTALADLSDVQNQINGIRDMRDAATEARNSYVGLAQSVKNAFVTMARGFIDIPIATVKAGVNGLVSAFQRLGTVAQNVAVKSFRLFGTSIKSALSKAGSLISSMISRLRTLGSMAKKSFSGMEKSAKKSNNAIGMSLKNILKYGLGIRSLFALINRFRAAIKEGFTNLYNGSETFKNTIDELKASLLTLKNAFAAAFRPIVEVAVPYIKKLLDYMTQAVNSAGQLMAALLGRRTYTKAIKQTTAALKEETKAQNKQLSSLDKLNNLTSQKDTGVDDGAAGMFEEEVPISDKWKNIAQWLKDMWQKSDFYELGKLLGEKLKEALDNIPWDQIKETARKIGKSIATFINGFIEVEGLGYSIGKTLAEAINTGFEFLNAFVHNLHWDSLGKFIAETINGFFQNIDWDLIYDTFVTGAKGLGNAINSFVDNLDWEAISSNIANFVNTFAATVLTFFTTVDWEAFGKRIGETLTETIKKIDFEKVGRAIGSVIQAAIDFVKNIISELSFEDVVSAITDLLKGFFEEANWTDIAKIALSLLASALVMQSSILKLSAVALAILSAFQDELLALDWKKAGETVGEAFKEFFSFIATTIENIDWWAVGESVKEFLVGIDWNGVFDALCEAIGAAFGAFAAFLGGLIAEGVVSAGEYFQDKIEEAGGNVVEGILVGIAEALVNIGAWIKEHVFEPFMEGFRKAFQIHSPSKAMESIGRYIIDGLLNGLKDSWKNIVSWIIDKINWLKEKISGMAGSFKSAFSGGGFGSRSTGAGGASYSTQSATPYAANPAFAALSTTPIPKLATGAVIPANKEFLAILGDQKRGTNIEAPLSTIKQAQRESMLEVLSELGLTGGRSNNSGNNVYEFSVDGHVFFRIMEKYASEYKKQHGGRPAFI